MTADKEGTVSGLEPWPAVVKRGRGRPRKNRAQTEETSAVLEAQAVIDAPAAAVEGEKTPKPTAGI